MVSLRTGLILAASSCVAVVAAVVIVGSREPAYVAGPPTVRLLSETQYRQAVAYVFGEDIEVASGFAPGLREGGLMEVGAAIGSVSGATVEQYEAIARSIAFQVVDERHRDNLIPCKPAASDKPDDACAEKFYAQVGRLLFRRPVPSEFIAKQVASAHAATETLQRGFYDGLAYGLAPILVDPRFLFRIETPSTDDPQRLDDYSMATRLSYFLWNATPDEALLDAAEKGELSRSSGLKAQVKRMLDSPRLHEGIRAFFADMLQYERFDSLSKDNTIYPKFSSEFSRDAQEQILRTIAHHLLDKNADYPSLFTTRETFMNRNLGTIYQVPVPTKVGWEQVQLPEDGPYAGLLTLVGFTALHSHPGTSSPTLRGKAIREELMCQKVPSPPADVSFSVFQDAANPDLRTARDRLDRHRTEPACAGCHKITDPIGLSLENFDGIGSSRISENDKSIEAHGDLDGVAFTNAKGLGEAFASNAAVPSCLVRRMFEYGVGRATGSKDRDWMDYLGQEFADDEYKVRALLQRIASSNAFYGAAPVAPPRGSVK
jgi:hypothetical protein